EPGLAPGLSVAHPRHAPLRARRQAAPSAPLLPARAPDGGLRLAAHRLSPHPERRASRRFFMPGRRSETLFRIADFVKAAFGAADTPRVKGGKLAPRFRSRSPRRQGISRRTLMKSWFGNLSVSRKLGFGFGVVLAITLLLALIGWNSLNKMIFRVDVLGEIARLDSATNRLQISRLEYVVADGSDEAGLRAQDRLAELQELHGRLLTLPLTLEASRQRINAMTAPINSYAQALQQVRTAFAETHVARRAMIAAGNTLIEQVNSLRDKIRAMDAGIPQRDSLIVGFTTFNDEFLMTRYEVRGFMMTRSADRERTLSNQMQKTGAALQDVEPLLTLYFPGELRQLKAALQAYFAPLDDYKKHVMTINAIGQELDRHAAQLVQTAAELQRTQYMLRDEDSTQSRILQIVAVLGALALGILAAAMISRQITQPLQETLEIAKRIADGDLTSETRVTRRDELGTLQRGIQDMAGTLRTLIGGIRDSAAQIASSAEELSVVTEQTSTGVGKQKEETDQVATAMHEMSATVQDVARNAELAAR